MHLLREAVAQLRCECILILELHVRDVGQVLPLGQHIPERLLVHHFQARRVDQATVLRHLDTKSLPKKPVASAVAGMWSDTT